MGSLTMSNTETQEQEVKGYDAHRRGRELVSAMHKARKSIPSARLSSEGNVVSEAGESEGTPPQRAAAETEGQPTQEPRQTGSEESGGEGEKPEPFHKHPRFKEINQQKNAAQEEAKRLTDLLKARDEELASLRERTAELAPKDLLAEAAKIKGYEDMTAEERVAILVNKGVQDALAKIDAKIEESVTRTATVPEAVTQLAEREALSQDLGFEVSREQFDVMASYKSTAPDLPARSLLVLAVNDHPELFQEKGAETPPASRFTTPAGGKSNVGVGGQEKLKEALSPQQAMLKAGGSRVGQAMAGVEIVRGLHRRRLAQEG